VYPNSLKEASEGSIFTLIVPNKARKRHQTGPKTQLSWPVAIDLQGEKKRGADRERESARKARDLGERATEKGRGLPCREWRSTQSHARNRKGSFFSHSDPLTPTRQQGFHTHLFHTIDPFIPQHRHTGLDRKEGELGKV